MEERLIPIHKTIEGEKEQWQFLIAKGKRNIRKRFLEMIFTAAGFSIAYCLFVLVIGINDFVVLKSLILVVLCGFWLLLLIRVPWVYMREIKHRRNGQRYLASLDALQEHELNYTLLLTNDKLVFCRDGWRLEYSWGTFVYYLESQNFLFVFNAVSRHDSMRYSRSDMGEANFNRFKAMVISKVPRMT